MIVAKWSWIGNLWKKNTKWTLISVWRNCSFFCRLQVAQICDRLRLETRVECKLSNNDFATRNRLNKLRKSTRVFPREWIFTVSFRKTLEKWVILFWICLQSEGILFEIHLFWNGRTMNSAISSNSKNSTLKSSLSKQNSLNCLQNLLEPVISWCSVSKCHWVFALPLLQSCMSQDG